MQREIGWKRPSVKCFIKDSKIAWWITGIFLLISYGIKVFNVSISHDTEAIISVPVDLYNSWYSMGRFGLIFLKKILGTYSFNPYVAPFLMVITMMACSMVWTYLFCWLEGKQRSHFVNNWIFPVGFFTSIIFAEQCGFLLQAYEVNVAFLLVGIALINSYDAILEKRRWYWYAPAVICCTVAFSTYQTLVPLFVAGASLCFLLIYDRYVKEERKFTLKFGVCLIVKLISVFVSAFLLYFLLSKLIMSILGMKTTSYITDQVMWKILTPQECIGRIMGHIFQVFGGGKIFYSHMIFVVYVIVIMFVLIRFGKRQKGYGLYFLAAGVSLCSPFLLLVLMGNAPTVRTEILIPFVVAFYLQYLVDLLFMWKGKAWKIVYPTVIVVLMFSFMNQSLQSAKLNYTQYIRYEEDVHLALKISDRIEQLGYGESPEIPVVFVGRRVPQNTPSCFSSDELELIGRSFFEVSFSTDHGTWVMNHFFKTIGYSYLLPSDDVAATATEAASDMPAWPDKGSVAVKNGVIIVKLGS